MKRGGNVLGVQDPYVVVEVAVEAASHSCAGEGGARREVGRLGEGVDAGIRPAGAVYAAFLSSQLQYSLLDLPLYRPPLGLELPAEVVGPVVFDCQLDIPHCASGSCGRRAAVTGIIANMDRAAVSIRRIGVNNMASRPYR